MSQTVREFALRVVQGTSIDEKLRPADPDLWDDDPGPILRLEEPGRPENLRIVPARKTKVPGIEGMPDPVQRPRILHALANHELQAAELYAWALLAFADAPAEFRADVLAILGDEQRHTRMYVARLEANGARFGDYPVSGYFWNKIETITTPLRFVCAMALTFENANLDHTIELAEAARRAGDEKTAKVIDRVHEDEIEHVRFGWKWLERLKRPEQSMWDAWQENLTWPLRPLKAKGRSFHPSGREAAGLAPEFIALLEAWEESSGLSEV